MNFCFYMNHKVVWLVKVLTTNTFNMLMEAFLLLKWRFWLNNKNFFLQSELWIKSGFYLERILLCSLRFFLFSLFLHAVTFLTFCLKEAAYWEMWLCHNAVPSHLVTQQVARQYLILMCFKNWFFLLYLYVHII